MSGFQPENIKASLLRFFSLLLLVLLLAGEFRPASQFAVAPTGLGTARRLDQKASLPALGEFTAQVQNGSANTLVGVYVPDVLAYPILQQPANQPGQVTNKPEALTQFGLSAQYGTVGLLAHNYLAGSQFFQLDRLEEVFLVYGDGSYKSYIISSIKSFEALSPNSPYSSFINLLNPGTTISVVDLFNSIYAVGDDRVVFQTCIEKGGLSTWGRIFVTALPSQKVLKQSYPSRFKQLYRE